MKVERDKLRIMLDQLRTGKTFEELDRDLNSQVCLPKSYSTCLSIKCSEMMKLLLTLRLIS